MNQSQSSKIRYAVAGLGVLTLLLVISWLFLRETPPPSPDLLPVKAITVLPRAPLFTPNNDASHETPTNTAAGSAPIPTNAATIYQQAFALYDALSQEQKGLLRDWRTNVDAMVAAELCEKLQPLCDLMQQAAAVSNCDWQVEQPVTFMTWLPQLEPCRHLARAAVWSAAHCQTDDPSAAVDNLVATLRLGQSASLMTGLTSHLINLSILQMVIDSATMQASTLAGDPRLVQFFNSANYDEELRQVIEQEADMSDRTADAMTTMSPEDVTHHLADFFAANSSVQLPSMEPAQAIADLRQAAELVRQYAQALDLPDAEYHAWLINRDEVGKTNPFVGALVTLLENTANRTQAMTVMSAMATAGLVVTQDGTDALSLHPDPTTGQAFTYNKTPDGFELESSFQLRGKSLKLSFK